MLKSNGGLPNFLQEMKNKKPDSLPIHTRNSCCSASDAPEIVGTLQAIPTNWTPLSPTMAKRSAHRLPGRRQKSSPNLGAWKIEAIYWPTNGLIPKILVLFDPKILEPPTFDDFCDHFDLDLGDPHCPKDWLHKALQQPSSIISKPRLR